MQPKDSKVPGIGVEKQPSLQIEGSEISITIKRQAPFETFTTDANDISGRDNPLTYHEIENIPISGEPT